MLRVRGHVRVSDCSVRLDELLWLYSTLLKLKLPAAYTPDCDWASLKVSASVAGVVFVTVVVSVKLPESLSKTLSLRPKKNVPLVVGEPVEVQVPCTEPLSLAPPLSDRLPVAVTVSLTLSVCWELTLLLSLDEEE